MKILSQTKSNLKLLRISGFFGVGTIIAGFAFITLAIASYSKFSWPNNALSDLGVVPGITSTLFNTGLVLTGIFAFIFAIGLFFYFKENIVGRIGSVFFALATLFLIAIGVFNESSPLHYPVSVAFFALLGIALLINTAAFAYKRQVKLALLTVILALIEVIIWTLFFAIRFVPNVAIPESLSAIAGSIWALMLSCLMIKKLKK